MAKKIEAKADNEALKATAKKGATSKETRITTKKDVAKKKPEEKPKRIVPDKKETDDIVFVEEVTANTSVKNKNVKDYSVEEKLYMLYKLQIIVSEIDKIKTLRGELPLEVQDLEDEIAGLKTRLEKCQAEIHEFDENVTAQKNKISESKLLIEKYKGQLDQVRNNREFDNLSKEVEFQELEVEFSEKKIKEFNAAIRQKKESISGNKEIIEGRKIDLEQKKKELQEIVAETRQEEEKLREKAKSIEEKIELRLLNAFKRIRKGARNGLAVVNIERDACGGCFNKIPPQKQLDIKLHKKIIVCEYCGRIMIDPEFANTIE
jgi:predicted  nucleic acid-binding Zn-ribbon protein